MHLLQSNLSHRPDGGSAASSLIICTLFFFNFFFLGLASHIYWFTFSENIRTQLRWAITDAVFFEDG